MTVAIEKAKIKIIRKHYIEGNINQTQLAKRIHISNNSVLRYTNEFREIKRLYPEKLNDYEFRLPKVVTAKVKTDLNLELIKCLPSLIDAYSLKKIQLIPLWKDYRAIYPGGYSLTWFTAHFIEWRRKNNICFYAHRRIKNVKEEDKVVLNRWKNSSDHKKWERAVAILESTNGKTITELSLQLERSVSCILKWIENYKDRGLEGLIDKPRVTNPELLRRAKANQDKVIKLYHETPMSYGFNRASWRVEDLAVVYKDQYKESIGKSTICTHLRNAGYAYRNSRQVLTSPDPKFREKLDHIKNILSHLGKTERFFSVDEFGHFSVKLKGGKSYIKNGDQKVIPQLQKSKGWLIVTAALELSTNQVTHFYSLAKNTDEMIKLIEILSAQYKTSSKLFISWDCAIWHMSKKLKQTIININEESYRDLHGTPIIELAPLPVSAQFLNVIESVFSGLAKAVIHNSNYQCLEDCRAAIDRHFKERNEHFLLNPKRAGRMIWGEEEVKPIFDEANCCKRPPHKTKKFE